MPRMLDVSEDVRAEIGDQEADRLLAGESAPSGYDCTSCRTPGDTEQECTSTVLFVGEETAVLAFAHASCIPSQVVRVAEDQLQGAVRSITGEQRSAAAPPVPAPVPGAAPDRTPPPEPAPGQAVLGITSGLILVSGALHPALVVEPTGPIARPGTDGSSGDVFLPLLIEQGFAPVHDVDRAPVPLSGWSVLLAMGQLHAVLQPGPAGGSPVAWWQAHQPLQVTEDWRTTANKTHTVLVYAAPAGSIGQQPREDLMRDALEKAAAGGRLVAAAMPLAGTGSS
ncbi:hypothetical protein I3J09_23455 [Streptomyces clavuligerus]|uniref:hypothetical protein n=1 Tax=Streptomyces clavuligerus TaxID=1901 RepID=UPI000810CEDC|nr:hypothetical protein [Streptomyces clavuligerus]ANW20898.1 hypothetical protein BB341_23150 [Streptomyces clavuligerus]QPL65518.1 hypothetical protein I3J04_23440 [Streptomyces clavuligerus]QPL71548.1 hypothetical protein I3J05_23450 [Streptomyces clavuligerus]QPL72378.1 hypothetical protein I3J05_28115 [Streptomyces clavuligerus]QPL77630.1 hypothetical protein I3J06_23455 [Streptomyces clavuligerus]